MAEKFNAKCNSQPEIEILTQRRREAEAQRREKDKKYIDRTHPNKAKGKRQKKAKGKSGGR
jgi:hypothetical protein